MPFTFDEATKKISNRAAAITPRITGTGITVAMSADVLVGINIVISSL